MLNRLPSRVPLALAGTLLLALPLPAVLVGCGDSGPHQIEEVRKISKVDPRELVERSPRERFAYAFPKGQQRGEMGGTASGGAPATGWASITPDGWTARPASGMRAISMEIPGDPPADLAVFVLPMSGMLDNVNRWRGQMGLPPTTEAALEGMAYEHRGKQAILVDLLGSYQGSGRKQRFLGLLKPHLGRLLSVKLVGDVAVVKANEDKFHAFLQSLQPKAKAAGGGNGADHGAALPDKTPGAMPGKTPGAMPGQPVGDEAGLKGRLSWETPAGWAEIQSASSRRIATFRIEGAPKLEVRINSLKGTGGGVTMISNMWANMVGRKPLAEDEIAGLKRMQILGREAVFFELDGQRAIEQGGASVETQLYGFMLPLGDETLFLRMLGEAGQVKPQRAAFLALCKSLRIKE